MPALLDHPITVRTPNHVKENTHRSRAPLLSLLAIACGALHSRHPRQHNAWLEAPAGTLQKMIVENGSVTMDLDLNGLNPEGFATPWWQDPSRCISL